jgi:flavin reductase (NADH)
MDVQRSGQPRPEAGGLDYQAFRTIMGSFASGVTVVTTRGRDGEPHGLTCSAVCSVSADPPLLLACIRTPSRTLDALRESGVFAVNFLEARARDVSRRFSGRDGARFDGLSWHPGAACGAPVLDHVLAYAECSTRQLIEAGDHVVAIGLLVGGDVDHSRLPLGYWRGSYMRMYRLDQPAAHPARVEEAESGADWHAVAGAVSGNGLEHISL